MTPKKYKRNKNETKIEFVTRIVVSEDKPMTANDVVRCIDKRSMKSVKPHNIHANLSDAVSKYDSLCKKRMENEQGKMRVHYYPCSMDVEGEDIPVPAFKRDGGNTFSNEPADEEEEANECWKCGSIVAMEDTVVEGTKSFCSSCAIPAPVKVAEKVLADLGASDDQPAKREPVVQRVDIGTGWVKMVDGLPQEFTPNAWTSIADCINTTPEELTRMFVQHLSSRTIDSDHKVAGMCFQIKEMLLDNYGLSAHRRQG